MLRDACMRYGLVSMNLDAISYDMRLQLALHAV
jgi:hypothetical protein